MKMPGEVGSMMVDMVRLVEVHPVMDFSTKIHVPQYTTIPLIHRVKTHDVSVTDFRVDPWAS